MNTPFQAYLESVHACAEARAWVANRTLAQAWASCPRVDWLSWLVTAEAGRAYEAAMAEPRRVYEAATAEAGRAYQAATAEPRRAYRVALAEAQRVYDAALAEALRAYRVARDEALRVYRAATAEAWAKYQAANGDPDAYRAQIACPEIGGVV